MLDELRYRGLIHTITPGTEELLHKGNVTGYIGFDPTADSLHIGSLVPIILLIHLHKNGHNPIALIGGATAMIGDPSGKNSERNLLDSETINNNIIGVKNQLSKFIDNDKILNNYDWFKEIYFLDFLRDIGKHISISYMLNKESVKKRIDSEAGISYTEFAYQLLQGYDFQYLYENHNVKLQVGGSDQWGNMITGTDLIRKNGGEAFVFTCPLITKADGTKFGKTEKGNIWLDRNKTTPFEFYQFWLNSSDEDSKNWIKIFTFLEKEEIESLIIEHDKAPHNRILQHRLADILTVFVHSVEDLELAKKASAILYGKSTIADLITLDDISFNTIFSGIEQFDVHKEDITDISTLLSVHTNIFKSKAEVRKMVDNKGLSINKVKVNINDDISILPINKILVSKGKTNYIINAI